MVCETEIPGPSSAVAHSHFQNREFVNLLETRHSGGHILYFVQYFILFPTLPCSLSLLQKNVISTQKLTVLLCALLRWQSQSNISISSTDIWQKFSSCSRGGTSTCGIWSRPTLTIPPAMWLWMNNTSNIYEICMTVWTLISSSSGHWCNILTSMHITPGGTPAICKLKHKGNTDLPNPTPSSPSPLHPNISLFFTEATLPTEQPQAIWCCPKNCLSSKADPSQWYQWKGWRKKEQKGNNHEAFKEKRNWVFF